jgi:hypothetical protein
VPRFVNGYAISRRVTGAGWHDRPMGDHDAAQAAELVRALRHQLHEMIAQLAWMQRQGVTGTNTRACAMRLEAAALGRDIKEAQFHIDRLERRYLGGHAASTVTAAAVKALPR